MRARSRGSILCKPHIRQGGDLVAQLWGNGIELSELPSHALVHPLRSAGVPAVDDVTAGVPFLTDGP